MHLEEKSKTVLNYGIFFAIFCLFIALLWQLFSLNTISSILAAVLALLSSIFLFKNKTQKGRLRILCIIVLVTGILFVIADHIDTILWEGVRPRCVGNPLDSLSSTMTDALSLETASTGKICSRDGNTISAGDIQGQTEGVRQVTFECGKIGFLQNKEDPICFGQNANIIVSSTEIKAQGDAQFRAIISCTPVGDKWDCVIGILSPTDY